MLNLFIIIYLIKSSDERRMGAAGVTGAGQQPQLNAGHSVDGQSAPGPSAAGQSARGPSPAGQSARGPSPAGQSVRGPSPAGQSARGPSPAGQSARGPSPAARSRPTRQGMIILEQPSGLPLALTPVRKPPGKGVNVIRIPKGQGNKLHDMLFLLLYLTYKYFCISSYLDSE